MNRYAADIFDSLFQTGYGIEAIDNECAHFSIQRLQNELDFVLAHHGLYRVVKDR